MASPSRYEQLEDLHESWYEEREYWREHRRQRAVAEDGGDGGTEGFSADEEEEEEEEEEGEEELEEREGVQLAAGDSEPLPRARVSGVAATAGAGSGAAVEGDTTSSCPVCMDQWTSQGPHRISCIPCGHVYGRSCLEKWLTQRGNGSAKCPQCGKIFKKKDIINLHAPGVAIPKSQLEKRQKDMEREIIYDVSSRKEMEQGTMYGVSSKRQKVAGDSCRIKYFDFYVQRR